MTDSQLILTLLGSGALALVGEIFLPTHGILGVGGVIALLVAVLKTMFLSPWLGLGELIALMIAAPFAWQAAWAIWPRTPIGKQMLLPAVSAALEPPKVHIGQTGIAVSELRPMGLCNFAGSTIEAASEIGMIESGRCVTVIGLHNRRPVVRAV